MELDWITGAVAIVALPLTAISALWPVFRDRSRLSLLERVARVADVPSLSNAERHRLAAYRRRLTRQVFVRTMLRRRSFDLSAGLYGIIAGPALFVASIVFLIGGLGRLDEALAALITSFVATAFGWLVLGLRKHRRRQDARKLLALYRSPIEPTTLRGLMERGSVRELARIPPTGRAPDGDPISAAPDI